MGWVMVIGGRGGGSGSPVLVSARTMTMIDDQKYST